MAIELTIDEELNAFSIFNTTTYKQLPFASSVAVNETAKHMRGAFNKGTNVFDRPNRFTQTAFRNTFANKNKLVSHVFAIDKQGADRSRYLKYATKGGTRLPKGFELFFTGIKNDGTIPSNAYFMPTDLVKKDAYGNISRSTLKRVTKGINGNARGGFFIGTPRNNNMPAGIYRRSRKQLFPYFTVTTKQPRYDKIFDLNRIGNKVVERKFNTYLGIAIDKAMATAR